MEATYCVYENRMLAHQEGDKYMHDMDGVGSPLEEFDSLEEAIAYADSYGLDEPTIYKAKRGLDSVGYTELIVDRFDGEEVEAVYVRSSLTDELQRKMEAHERAYWDFLDYEESYYPSLAEC